MAERKSNTGQELVTVSQDPSQLLQLAVKQDLDVEKLGKLMELQERWQAHEARRAFFDAMCRFQSILPIMSKNQAVDFTTDKGRTYYTYANLAEIVQTIKKPLADCGLSYRFEIAQIEDELEVASIITHRDGHSERTVMSAPLDTSGRKNSVQARGSTTTYLERYTIMGALGIATGDTDDDGRQAQPADTKKRTTRGDQWLNLKPNDPVPSGKHMGKSVRDLPVGYLKHLGEKNPTYREFCSRELERRATKKSATNKPATQSGPRWKVPAINDITKAMNPATVKSIMQDRYSTDQPNKLTKSECENFLAYLQAEVGTREHYGLDPDIGKNTMAARFGQHAEYRKLEPEQMKELGAVLKARVQIEAAREQIPSKFGPILADWENATGETLETATGDQYRQLVFSLQSNGFEG